MIKFIAVLLIICSLLVLAAMIIDYPPLWFIIDILVIITCGYSGIYLLLNKKK